MFKIYHFYFSFLSLNGLNKDQWLKRSTVKRSADKEINGQKDQVLKRSSGKRSNEARSIQCEFRCR